MGMSKQSNKLATAIRNAIEQDERSLYAIAKAAGVTYQTLHPFARGQREDITIGTADRLCKVLGLELLPIRKNAKR